MDENLDLMSGAIRKGIIQEINSEENKEAKRKSLKQFEIYAGRQDRFVIEKLRQEYSEQTVTDMSKCLTINLSEKIIQEKANIYQNEPERVFGNVNDKEREQLENVYFHAMADIKLLHSNRYFKLQKQQLIQIRPDDDVLGIRPLLRHHYDVVPDVNNPSKPYAVILSVFDKFDFLQNTDVEAFTNRRQVNERVTPYSNNSDEKIADQDDYKAKKDRYVVWTKDYNFVMNGDGTILSDDVENHIGLLPFVDISEFKDGEYFVRQGSDVTDFTIEFSAGLSTVENLFKFQGYSQAIVYGEKQPKDMVIGTNRILFMQLDPNRPEVQPRFEFASPSPNLEAGIAILENKLRFYLTSEGLDPKIVSGQGDAQRFTSGIERLLAMIDRFTASKTDYALYRKAEDQIFKLLVAYSNAYQGVTDPDKKLIDDLNIAVINDKATLEVIYAEPTTVQGKAELEASVMSLLDKKLMSRKEAIMELRGIDEEMALEVLEKIDEDKEDIKSFMPSFSSQPQMDNDDEVENEPTGEDDEKTKDQDQ